MRFKAGLKNIIKSKYAAVTAVLFLVLLAHASYISNDFTWLDHGDIEHGAGVAPLASLVRVFVLPFGTTNFYRPLVTVFHSADAALYGLSAPGFHFTNVLLHLAAVAAAVLFSRTFFGFNMRDSLLVSLIFGIHPLSWLPVGAISYRPEILLALFTFLTVYFHIKSRLLNSWFYGLLAIVAFAAGLFSKETALLVIPLLITWWESRRFFTRPEKPAYSYYILPAAEIFLLTIYVWLRLKIIPGIWPAPVQQLSSIEKISTGLAGFGKALTHMINPLRPSLSDSFPVGGTWPLIFTAVIFLAGGVWLIQRTGFHSRMSRIIIFLTVSLAPTLNILPLPRFTSPHYAFLASLGACALSVTLLNEIHSRRKQYYKFVLIVFAVWLVIMAFTTFRSGYLFKNDGTLFAPDVENDPGFLEGAFYLGTYYFQQKEYARAELEYEAILSADTNRIAFLNRPALLINLARVKAQKHDYKAADALLLQLGQEEPAFLPLSLFNRALFWAAQNNDKMVVELLKSLPGGWKSWQRPEPLQVLQQSLINLGRLKEADEVNAEVAKFFNR